MSLISQLMGTPELSAIDDKIDSIINATKVNYNSQESKDKQNLEDATGNFLGLMDKEKQSTSEFDQLFQNITIPSFRLQRYNLYDELYKSVPLIQRVLTVYISNIVPKNPVNDSVFILNEKEIDSDNSEQKIDFNEYKNQVKDFLKKFNLAQKYKKIILPNRLKYGDFFVEIINVNKSIDIDKLADSISADGTVLTESKKEKSFNSFKNEKSLLLECEQLLEVFKKSNGQNIIQENTYQRLSNVLIDVEEYDTNLKSVYEINKLLQEEDQSQEEQTLDYDNILLRYHKPHNIVILETKYGTNLGYLEVSNTQSDNVNSMLSTMVQKVTKVNDTSSQSTNVNKLIKYALFNILNKNKNFKQSSDKNTINNVLNSLDPNVYKFIKRIIIEQDLDKNTVSANRVRVRFIPPKNMVHFNNPDASNYAPFASSVVDPLLLPGKLFMLTQMSNIITKLSRASIIRKWTIDTGPSRMSKQNINKLKREIFNTRVTLNDLGSFKTISKILSDFRDMFVISQNGRTPIDMSIENTGDTNVKIEDLKDLRNEIVSLSGIPAPYLGMNDVIELREQLSNINQNFAVEISNHQDNDIRAINELMYKTFNELVEDKKDNPTNFIRITLIPPITLILQLLEGTLNSVGNISNIFNTLKIPVDPYHLLEQYVPHIDWTSFRLKAEKYKLKETTKNEVKSKSGIGGDDGGSRY